MMEGSQSINSCTTWRQNHLFLIGLFSVFRADSGVWNRLNLLLFSQIGSPFELLVLTGSPHKSQAIPSPDPRTICAGPLLLLWPSGAQVFNWLGDQGGTVANPTVVALYIENASGSSLFTMRGSTVGSSYLLSSNLSALQLHVDLHPQQRLLVTHFLSSLFTSVLNTLHWLPNAHCPVEVFVCTFIPPKSHREQQISKFSPLIFDFQQSKAQDVAA